MKIKKAVIAAAGRGTRFLPVTKAYPKELLPILNKPVIQVLIEEIIGAGIEEIAVVHHAESPAVSSYFSPDRSLEKFLRRNNKLDWLESLENIRKRVKKLVFIPQSPTLHYGTGSPIIAARDFIGKEPFAYLYGDDLIGEEIVGTYLKTLTATFVSKKVSAVVAVDRVPWSEVVHFGTIRFKDSSRPELIVRIEEKLSEDNAPSNYVDFGRFILTPEVIRFIETLNPGQHEELMFIEAINELAKKSAVYALPIVGARWLTVGSPAKWLEANLAFQKLWKL